MPSANPNPADFTAPGSPTIGGRPGLVGAVLIVAAVLCAYFPALRCGFVWNDADYVTRPGLRSVHGLARIWLRPGATEQYYPVLHTAFWTEHRLWGDRPLGYHLLNVLLHALSACLFWQILRRLAVPWAWLAGAIFAVHPVCVESVAWISEQKNTLSLVFYLLAALAYLRFDENRQLDRGGRRPPVSATAAAWRRLPRRSSRSANEDGRAPLQWLRLGKPGSFYLLALGLFILALLSKSVTASLPAALLVIFWWQRGRLSWRDDVRPLLPFFVLGAADGLFTAWIERTSIGAAGPDFALSAAQRYLVAGRALWFYLGKLAWPSPLIFMYPRWRLDPASVGQQLFPLAALATLLALWLVRKRSRTPLAVALLFVGSLFPVLGFLNVYAFVFSFVADHFQYLACLGAIAGAVGLLGTGLGHGLRGNPPPPAGRGLRRASAAIAAGTALALLGFLTWRQCNHYHDETTLYRSILAENPGSWLPNYNLANLLRESGRSREAVPLYEQALRSNPRHSGAENNLGLALVDLGQPAAAAAHYRRALQLNPAYAAAKNNLGTAEWALGQNAEAIACYHQALQLNPAYAEAWYNLGLSLNSEGRLADAVAAFARAVEFRPGFPEAVKALAGACNNLGIALYSSGRTAEAIVQFDKALRLDPRSRETHLNLAIALRKLGRTKEAQDEDRAAIRLKGGAGTP